MSPRFDPRLYVVRLAWLGRCAAGRGMGAPYAGPRSIPGRVGLFGDRRSARNRWLRPTFGRGHT